MTAKGLRAAPSWARVMVVMAVASVVAFFVTLHVTDQQEKTLLQRDTAQAGALTSSMFSDNVALLESLSTTVTTTAGSTTAFLAQAQPLVKSPNSIALAKEYLAHFVVFASVGDAFKTGQLFSDAAVAAIHSAARTLRPVPVLTLGGPGVADFAVGPPFVPSGDLIYLQTNVSQFMATRLATASTFSNLRLALYGSTRPAPSTLIASTGGDVPLVGPVNSTPVIVGDTTWTLVAAARSPLVGGLAHDAPLIVLLLGLSLAVVFGMTADRVEKRRKAAKVTLAPGESVASIPVGTSQQAETITVRPKGESVTVPPQADSVALPPPNQPVAPELDALEASDSLPPASDESEPLQAPQPLWSVYADWRPDPFGRFELRRFFLDRPTSVVRTGDIEGYDPVTALIEQNAGTSRPMPDETAEISTSESHSKDGAAGGEPPPHAGETKSVTDEDEPGADTGTTAAQADGDRPGPDEEAATESLTTATDQPTDDVPEAVEMLATRVAPAIARELDAQAPGTSDTESPVHAPGGPSTRTAPPSVTPHGNGVHPPRKHEPVRVLAVAGGLLGAVSLLRRHFRKPPRPR
jgi:hypothetical protein